MTTWRVIPYSERPAADELAASEALLARLEQTGRPTLRWYGARQLALVLGSGQRPGEADGTALAALGATLHKRASGGSAVLFVPGFLMQDVALPTHHPLRVDDVSESYRWLGELWADTLARLGVGATPISIAEARADTASADPLLRRACFGGRSPFELLAGGRKLVGFAQIRRRQGALLQVGVYARWPGRQLAALLRLNPAERDALAAALAERVVGLDELLPAPPSAESIMLAFAEALAARHGVNLEREDWRSDELEAASAGLSRFRAIDLAATLPPNSAS
jgi:lipoate-protein ligase A